MILLPNWRFFIIRFYLLVAVLITCTEVFSFTDSISGLDAAGSERIILNFNTHWLFSRSNSADYSRTAGNDSLFEMVTLPHTVAVIPHSQIDTSVYGQVTWYRKHFYLASNLKSRHITVEFQAVSKTAEVFCNGKKAGSHTGAYTPFSVDISDFVLFGKNNVITVRVDSRQHKDIPPEGLDVDYMIGGGIIRDVNLIITNPVHISWVYARLDTSCNNCIDLTVNISNQGTINSSGYIKASLMTDGKTAGESDSIHYSIAPGKEAVVQTVIEPIQSLIEWNPDNPFLYTLQSRLFSGNKCRDVYLQRIGVRSIEFSRTDGVCRINGHPVKLRGLNRHETYPFIGRAASNRLQRRDADIIKYDYGCNIVRCSHYPQDPEFLSRCDEIGLMVLEEMAGWNYVSVDSTWQNNALNNLKEMIIRDRNHPSIISFGVRVNQSADFRRFYRETNRIAHTLAPDIPTHGVRVFGRGSESEFMEDIWAQNFTIPTGNPATFPWITTESVGHHFPAHSWDDDARLVGQMLFHARVQDSAAMNPKSFRNTWVVCV
jgi:beta-galactosidase